MQKHPTHILIAGCGDLGCALAALLLNTGHKVSALRRSDSALPHGAQSLRGDVTQPATLQNLAALKPDILFKDSYSEKPIFLMTPSDLSCLRSSQMPGFR